MKRKIALFVSALALGLCSCGTSTSYVTGPQGEQGIQGEKGNDGSDGLSLLVGEGNPDNSLGKDGDSYIDTLTFDYYSKKDGSWIKLGNIKCSDGIDGEKGDTGETGAQGEKGTDGSDGLSILSGKGIPDNSLGKDGDSYIDTSTFDYYSKNDGVWTKIGNIKGSDGSDGEKGEQGIQGEQGEDGKDGTDGKSAYDIYVENYPNYPGTEKDWIRDLALGKLAVTVHFETNVGSEVEDITYCRGEEVKISQVTSKDDYAFTGWYSDIETTKLASSEFIALEDITLYAGFHPNSVSITYMVNDAIYSVDTFDYGTTIDNLIDAPERLGYVFNDWKAENEDFDVQKALTNDVVLVGDYSIDQLELPYIEINTEEKAEIASKDTYVNATISIGGTENNQYDLSNLAGKVKGRGNSTWGQPKKPYKIKFDKKQSLFGSSYKAKSWVLLANYFDKSLSRNALAYELSSRMNSISFSPARQYVDVYLNGVYVGVYLLTDQIETGSGRVDIDESEATDGNTGYLMELDQPSRIEADGAVLNESYFQSNGFSFAFKTPDIEDEYFINNHETCISYIKTYMDNCFTAMQGTNWETITNLMDVESFAETYLIQELFANNDCGYSSFYLVKDKDGKLEAGPVWDFDIGAGNINYNMGSSTGCSPDARLWANTANIFYMYLLRHSEFKQLVTQKIYSYNQTFVDVISLADSTNADGYYQMYQNALNRNFAKWNIMGKYVWPEPNDVVALSTVPDQMDYLYNWLTKRFAYMKTQYPQATENQETQE